jgi:hypothetical protein
MYRFTSHPKEISQDEYIRQQENFLQDIWEIPAVISIYSIWELWLLGVSDIDLLIIFDRKIDSTYIRNITKKYSLIDTILFLDISNIENKNYISHHMKYDLIYGKNLSLSFDENNRNLNIIYAWKVCFCSLLRNFYYYKYNNKIHIKNLLSQINDMRYPIYFLKNLWIEKEKYNDFIDRFSGYRSSYFSHNDYRKLEWFLNEAIDISWYIVFDLEKELEIKWKQSYCYGRFSSIFKKFDKQKYYREKTERKLKYVGKFSRFLYLPLWFDHRRWTNSLSTDLERISKNNNDFLNFSLPSRMWKVLLLCKKGIDFICLRTF